MKLPKIQNYSSCQDYFIEFVEININAPKSRASFRSIAIKLNWPTSYLPDVTKGRKNLTISRALQFIQESKMNIFDAERLFYLALMGSGDHQIESYFSKKIQNEYSRDRKLTDKHRHLYEDFSIVAVFEVLKFYRKRVDSKKIKALLYTFPGLTEKKIDQHINNLVDEHVLRIIDGDKIEIIQERLNYDTDDEWGLELQKNFANNLASHLNYSEKNYDSKTGRPSSLSSIFVQLPIENFSEVDDKLMMSHNWISSFGDEISKKSDKDHKKHQIFQVDFNIFPLLDGDEI